MTVRAVEKPAFEKPVPITEPTLPPIETLVRRYEEIVKSRMITNAGCVREFEAAVAAHLGVKHAIAVSSCTSGLMLILRAMELEPGEVILPSFTFHATAHAVVWHQHKPVFVDCDPETYTIDPAEVEKAVTSKTRAIIGVHVFGNPCDVEALERVARERKLRLLFDAAHGFGSSHQSRPIGGFGDAESFSLSPTKLVTCGEGGIVSTDDDLIAERVRVGRNYGDGGDYDPAFSGLNARMSEFNALMGIESLRLLDANVRRRNGAVELYKRRLSKLPGIGFQAVRSGNRSSYKDFSIFIDARRFGMSRDRLHEALMKENIVVKDYFCPPVHRQKAFARFGQSKKNLPHSDRLAQNSLSLPLFSHIEDAVIEKICAVIERLHGK